MKVMFDMVHISTIRQGDCIEHNGELITVSGKFIRDCSFMGRSIYGDTYHLGLKPVKKLRAGTDGRIARIKGD